MKAILVQLQINRVTLKKDDSVSFSAETPELTDDELALFRKLGKVTVKALLEPMEGSEDVVDIKKEVDEKSPSQRLRGVLFRLHEQDSEGMEWEVYYRVKMEKIIDHLKGKLD